MYNLTPSFRERVKTVIAYEEAQRLKKTKAMRFWPLYKETFPAVQIDSPDSPGYGWLKDLFTDNHIKLQEFIAWVEVIAVNMLNKTNALLLFGPRPIEPLRPIA